MMNTDPRSILISALCGVVLGAFAGWLVNGWRLNGEIETLKADHARIESAKDRTITEETGKRSAAENKLRDANAELAVANQRIEDYAKTKVSSLRADVRSGAISLSVPTKGQCTSPGAATRSAAAEPAAEARTDLLPGFADRLVDRSARCDTEVRERNELIDRYNAARDMLKQFANQQ